MTENIQSVKETLAGIIGEDPANIHDRDVRWLRFMRQGVIVTIHIGRWRARSKLTYGDLGLPEPTSKDEMATLNDLLILGRKNLLPIRYMRLFDAIDSRARKRVNSAGLSTYWGEFVTANAYPELREKLESDRAEYMGALQEMISDWPAVRSELADEYRAAARNAYFRLSRLAPEDLPGETEFVETFVANILDMIPTPEEIESSFSFSWDLHFIPLPSLLEADRVVAEQMRMKIETERDRERLERQREHDKLTAERDRERLALEMERKLRESELALQREVAERANAEKEQLLTGFMRDVVSQVRGMVYDAATDVLSSINRNDQIHPRSVVQLRNLMDQVSSLTFFGDQDIDQMMGEIRSKLAGASDRNTGDLAATLRAIGTITRQSLLTIGDRPRSGRSVGIADIPTAGEIRTARASLNLPDIAPVENRRIRRPAESAVETPVL